MNGWTELGNPAWKRVYYAIRPIIPIKLRWLLQKNVAERIDGFSSQPMWPLPEKNSLRDSRVKENDWKSPFVITHDIDTRFGFEHIEEVAEVEMRLGFKSSWNIVPNLYEVNESILEYLRSSGMEIGVHDWNHDGRLFSDKKIFNERVKKINRVMRGWGAKGFRAGMVFHNDEWMQELECDYDSSYYDTDPYQPMGGGCCSIWPFMLGHLVELPYTMPQDHVLFVAKAEVKVPQEYHSEDYRRRENWDWIRRYINDNLGIEELRNLGIKGKSKIVIRGVDIWKMKAEWLVEQDGMVLMITHPDYLCHPKLIRRFRRLTQIRKNERFYDGWLGVGAKSMAHRAERKYTYDGWLGEDDRDVQAVRERGIVEEKWFGSLLEQYAAFLNWFKREYAGQYWHCLPRELIHRFRRLAQIRD